MFFGWRWLMALHRCTGYFHWMAGWTPRDPVHGSPMEVVTDWPGEQQCGQWHCRCSWESLGWSLQWNLTNFWWLCPRKQKQIPGLDSVPDFGCNHCPFLLLGETKCVTQRKQSKGSASVAVLDKTGTNQLVEHDSLNPIWSLLNPFCAVTTLSTTLFCQLKRFTKTNHREPSIGMP